MKLPIKPIWETTKKYAGIVWRVDAVKSLAITWLIRVGVPSGIVGIGVAIADAVNGGVQ